MRFEHSRPRPVPSVECLVEAPGELGEGNPDDFAKGPKFDHINSPLPPFALAHKRLRLLELFGKVLLSESGARALRTQPGQE